MARTADCRLQALVESGGLKVAQQGGEDITAGAVGARWEEQVFQALVGQPKTLERSLQHSSVCCKLWAETELETTECSVVILSQRNFEKDAYTDSPWRGQFLDDDDAATSTPVTGGETPQNQSLLDHSECRKERPSKLKEPEKPYRCEHCPTAFDLESQRRHHMRSHTPVAGHKCEICSKTFRSCYSLEKHMPTHSGDKSFECRVCGKMVPFRSEVGRHVGTHTGERPFQCSVCPKAFTHSGNLKVHIRTHTGERPSQCCRCGCAFLPRKSSEDTFLRKVKIERGSSPYTLPARSNRTIRELLNPRAQFCLR
ncbi:uncharacterized protein LOC144179867 [Haemaphysalis longicornis]